MSHRHVGPSGPVVVFVEVPVAGSPKSLREVKPGQYKRNPPTHWQPRTRPPSLLEAIVRQEAAVRSMLRPQHQR
jgi:hypothetical protein